MKHNGIKKTFFEERCDRSMTTMKGKPAVFVRSEEKRHTWANSRKRKSYHNSQSEKKAAALPSIMLALEWAKKDNRVLHGWVVEQ